eukprot:XP_014039337.1 PREDICTED: tyrosine-protein kinase receptor UFO-like [Salmo salar]
MIHNRNVNIPPASHLIGDLEPNSGYAVRLACHTTQGVSDWTHWATLHTAEGGRTTPLMNPPFFLNVGHSRVLLASKWETARLSHYRLSHYRLSHYRLSLYRLSHSRLSHYRLSHYRLSHYRLSHYRLSHYRLSHYRLSH